MGTWLIGILFALGAYWLLRPAPSAGAPALLRRFGRGAGIEFRFDADGRLSSGGGVEGVLSAVISRLSRARGTFLVSVGVTIFLMTRGPTLSQSDLKSVVVATVVCASVIGPYLWLREFFAPVAGPETGTRRAGVSVDDYLNPVRRVVTWLVAVSALAVPVGAVLVSVTSSYDGSKIYWEGLVALPLVSAGVVLATELELRGTRDSTSDPGLLYLWDALRGRAVRMSTLVGVVGAAIAWQMAEQGLSGVALDVPVAPAWVAMARGVATTLEVVCSVVALWMVVLPASRFRRLWPDLAPGEKVVWGGQPVETPCPLSARSTGLAG